MNELTELQIKIIKEIAKGEKSIVKICSENKINKNEYYSIWKKDEQFNDLLQEEIKKHKEYMKQHKMKEGEVEKRCERCKNIFYTNDDQVTYCSKNCRDKMKKNKCKKCNKSFYSIFKKSYCSDECKKRNCIVCGKEFIINSGSAKTCSEECRNKSYKNKCKTCGIVFFAQTKKIYCSKECRYSYQYKKICLNCNKRFESVSDNSKYCSEDCMKQYYKNNLKEANELDLLELVKNRVSLLLDKRSNSVLSTTYSTVDYYEINGFTNDLKNQVKERDGFQCFICNNKVDLEVHHITPRKLGGTHEKENLITLCKKCHRHIETGNKEHAIRKCFNNARIYYNIPFVEFEDELVKVEKINIIKNELNVIYKKLIEFNGTYEISETLVQLDNLIDIANYI